MLPIQSPHTDSICENDTSLQIFDDFFEWYIREDKLIGCNQLVQILNFKTTNNIQTYSEWEKLTHPEDRHLGKQTVTNVKTKQTLYVMSDTRKLCRDGQWRWFSVRGKCIEFDSDGNPIRAVGTVSNTSKIKEAELELKNLQLLLNETSILKKTFKQNMSFPDVSALAITAFERATCSQNGALYFSPSGCTPQNTDQNLYNLNLINIRHLNLSSGKLAFIQKIATDKKHQFYNNGDHNLLGIDLELPLQQHAILILERHKPYEIDIIEFIDPLIGTTNNILSIRNLESKNYELDNIFHFFMKQFPEPVAIFDVNMRYKFASNAWQKEFLGSETINFIGQSHYDLCPDQPKSWCKLYDRALKGELIRTQEEEVCLIPDRILWVETIIHPWYRYSNNQEIGGIIVYSNIVTDRKKSEKKLQTIVSNLIVSNQALERFAHVCSHDLTEPLRTVSNFIQLLLNHNSNQYDEESLVYVNHILNGINHMRELIKGILLYSNITGQTVHTQTPLDLNTIIEMVKESLTLQLVENNVQLNVDNLPTVMAEPTQIKQLFINLFANAIKFHSDAPLIIDIFAIDKATFWEFHVRDNGIGIEPEYHSSIFTMFKRLHHRNQFEGSGIGLATCKKIVNDHHGEISVESNIGKGSDFIFTLPKMKEAA